MVAMLNSTDYETVPPMARFALLLLAYRMWQTGADRYCAFPSLTRLSREMGCARNTTKRALKQLRERELVMVSRGGEAKGRKRRTNVYRLGDRVMRVIERPRLHAVGE